MQQGNPPLTDADLARGKPRRDNPKKLAKFKGATRRGPQKKPAKTPVSIRLDRDILAAIQAEHPTGWQLQINALLCKALKLPARYSAPAA